MLNAHQRARQKKVYPSLAPPPPLIPPPCEGGGGRNDGRTEVNPFFIYVFLYCRPYRGHTRGFPTAGANPRVRPL
jgi:hypothetical protein